MGSVKKRGRPVGSKNKPKAKAIPKKVDWEKLAKHLQKALQDEFVENERLQNKIGDLNFEVANLKHQAIGYRAVVSYLENKIEHDTVRSD